MPPSSLSFYREGKRETVSLDKLWEEKFNLKWVIGLPGLPHLNLGKVGGVTCEKTSNYLVNYLVYSSNLFFGRLNIRVPLERGQEEFILPIGYYICQ
jgi:hypothetical protein